LAQRELSDYGNNNLKDIRKNSTTDSMQICSYFHAVICGGSWPLFFFFAKLQKGRKKFSNLKIRNFAGIFSKLRKKSAQPAFCPS
jgi:hypothetical protein